MAIYFVRHGETDCNVKQVYYGSLDADITDNGRKQAEAVGDMLSEVVFDRVITSALKRTMQTAEGVLSRQNPENPEPSEWQAEAALNEMHFGAWEGLHYTEVREHYPKDYRDMMDDWVHCPPTEGEVFLDFNHRVLEGWKHLDISEEENILFVGHGGTIQCIMCHLLGMDATNIWHLEIEQGAYTKFEIRDGFAVLKGMNIIGRPLSVLDRGGKMILK
ncbi:MAG: alpha-ribazole phosphatase [Clostridia bacterium]|jgi:alpha-ribazole phosphatase|nr:alpha-ribazole phosphatase [Lachnospiraceae bacterium]NCC00342.1 alpha-ribazole phosphatase [Clostridia bacterium]NCD03908.1 alpha-ribazole phosphatase [Clostridia bacterium]